jgi:hypothetical protein
MAPMATGALSYEAKLAGASLRGLPPRETLHSERLVASVYPIRARPPYRFRSAETQ